MRPLVLRDREIAVWKADLDRASVAMPGLRQTLALAERKHFSQFSRALDRSRYTASRAILRTILAGYLGENPARLKFRRGPYGKPELAGREIQFNVSHSHRLAVYVFSRSLEVGIDIERIRAGVHEDLADWLLPLCAIRCLHALPPAQCKRVFFQAWTRMEAHSKALGVGLTRGVADFETFLDAPGCSAGRLFRTSSFWIHDFLPQRGYAAALAVRGGNHYLNFWKWPTRPFPQS